MLHIIVFIKCVCQYVESPLAVSVENQLLPGLKYFLQFKDVDILRKENTLIPLFIDNAANLSLCFVVNTSSTINWLMRQRKQEFITGILDSYRDLIPPLVQLMDHDDNLIMIPALQTIVEVVSNGNEHHNEMVLNSGLLPILAKLLKHSHSSVVNSIAYIIEQIATESVAQIEALFTHKVVEGLLNLLVDGNQLLKRSAVLAIIRILEGTF